MRIIVAVAVALALGALAISPGAAAPDCAPPFIEQTVTQETLVGTEYLWVGLNPAGNPAWGHTQWSETEPSLSLLPGSKWSWHKTSEQRSVVEVVDSIETVPNPAYDPECGQDSDEESKDEDEQSEGDESEGEESKGEDEQSEGDESKDKDEQSKKTEGSGPAAPLTKIAPQVFYPVFATATGAGEGDDDEMSADECLTVLHTFPGVTLVAMSCGNTADYEGAFYVTRGGQYHLVAGQVTEATLFLVVR